VNGTRLDEFSRDPGPIVNLLFDARATGGINAGTPLPETSDLIGQNGRPEWKVSSSFTWSQGPIRVGLSSQYVSSFEQPGLLGASGNPWEVDSQLVTSLYGQYEFADSTRVRVGVRDLTDEGPPLADGGYRGSVHNPWGRYVYVNIRREF
jgi:iron complex outermembrane receptor protein